MYLAWHRHLIAPLKSWEAALIRAILFAFLLIAGMASSNASAQISAREWADYSKRFISSEGRVIDDGNHNISHSEGQGYGLLLAYLAGNRADFERIWSFTEREFLLRDDNLSAWRWDPSAVPHITDLNNASDGDILIAYALARAGTAWNEARFIRKAQIIAKAIGRTSVLEHHGELLLLPGVTGFGAKDRPDGPVVNLSYWVFEAFPYFASLAPHTNWQRLAESGKRLIRKSQLGERALPPEWLSLANAPKTAQGFPATFGYNALRIPLYLMRALDDDKELLRRLRDGMTGSNGELIIVDTVNGKVIDSLNDAGYRIIPALASCVVDGAKIPAALQNFQPSLYYPSTLQLLALSHIREDRPECL